MAFEAEKKRLAKLAEEAAAETARLAKIKADAEAEAIRLAKIDAEAAAAAALAKTLADLAEKEKLEAEAIVAEIIARGVAAAEKYLLENDANKQLEVAQNEYLLNLKLLKSQNQLLINSQKEFIITLNNF